MRRKSGRPALLIVDMLNMLDFDAGDALLKQAMPAAAKIASLKRRIQECWRSGHLCEWQLRAMACGLHGNCEDLQRRGV